MKKRILILIFILLCVTTFIVKSQTKDTIVEARDNRAEIIDNYYKARNMPLQGYGQKMVEIADTYGLDWRLLPAISIRETFGGKHMCKNIKAQNNPFGWGSCKIGFYSIDRAIETVGYKLVNLSVYQDKTTEQKLYHYNGTVIKTYPAEVLAIMETIK